MIGHYALAQESAKEIIKLQQKEKTSVNEHFNYEDELVDELLMPHSVKMIETPSGKLLLNISYRVAGFEYKSTLAGQIVHLLEFRRDLGCIVHVDKKRIQTYSLCDGFKLLPNLPKKADHAVEQAMGYYEENFRFIVAEDNTLNFYSYELSSASGLLLYLDRRLRLNGTIVDFDVSFELQMVAVITEAMVV